MSTDAPNVCVVIKNAPVNTTIRDLVDFFSHGDTTIHHGRIHTNEHGMPLLFLYFYNTASACAFVINYNHVSFFGRNLNISMHRDSKNDIMNMLFSESCKRKMR